MFALEHAIFRVVYKLGDWATFLGTLSYECYRFVFIGLFLIYWFNCQRSYFAKKMQFLLFFQLKRIQIMLYARDEPIIRS